MEKLRKRESIDIQLQKKIRNKYEKVKSGEQEY
jgi:hypothetical protein